MEEERTPSTPVMILQLLGYVLAFAIPTAIAALLLPAYAPWIVVAVGLLFFAISAFILGWQWDDPEWTRQIRMHMLQSGVAFLVFLIVVAAMDGVREGSLRRSLATSAVTISVIAVPALIGFFVGLWTHRHGLRART